MNPAPTPVVCVVVVTYGSRAALLEQVVAGLAAQSRQPDCVLIVDNAASKPPRAVLESLVHEWPVESIPMGANRGSAVGFGAGMRRALELGCDLIWLLDDDNVPYPSALAHLVRRWEESADRTTTSFAAMRRSRRKYVDASLGLPTMRFSPPNSFMGSSPLHRVASRFTRATSTPELAQQGDLVVDVAIYGGLLIPRTLLERTGLPDPAYYVYLDDRDFTTRLTRAGGRIVLVPEAVVEDVDDSWGGDEESRYPVLFSRSVQEDKVYYTVRNAVHYERTYMVSARPVYFVNMLAHLGLGTVRALRRGVGPRFVLARIRLLRRAIVDGWRGRLGERRV